MARARIARTRGIPARRFRARSSMWCRFSCTRPRAKHNGKASSRPCGVFSGIGERVRSRPSPFTEGVRTCSASPQTRLLRGLSGRYAEFMGWKAWGMTRAPLVAGLVLGCAACSSDDGGKGTGGVHGARDGGVTEGGGGAGGASAGGHPAAGGFAATRGGAAGIPIAPDGSSEPAPDSGKLADASSEPIPDSGKLGDASVLPDGNAVEAGARDSAADAPDGSESITITVVAAPDGCGCLDIWTRDPPVETSEVIYQQCQGDFAQGCPFQVRRGSQFDVICCQPGISFDSGSFSGSLDATRPQSICSIDPDLSGPFAECFINGVQAPETITVGWVQN